MNKNSLLLPLLLTLLAGCGKIEHTTMTAPPPTPASSPAPSPMAETGTPPTGAAVPSGGSSVIAPDWRAEISTKTKFGAAESSAPDPGLKLITTEQPEHTYDLQATVLNAVPVKKGDTILVRFAARSLKSDFASGVTKLKVGFGKSSAPWDSSYSGEIGVGAAWQRFDIPFTCKNDFVAKDARVVFQFGYPVQTAEIADVQCLDFGTSVLPSALPKTARHADAVSPEVLAAEIARIAKMRAEVSAFAKPVPANGRTLHVSASATAAGDGSEAAPFNSLSRAIATVKPGDTVLVADGEYRDVGGFAIKTSGTPDAWIKIKAAPGARPKIISSGWLGFGMRGGLGYIEIEGFDIGWVPNPNPAPDAKPVHGSGIAMEYATHHIRVINNVIHGFGTGGIISLDCDYLCIEGNVVYDTSKTSPYGGSAISLCRAFDFDRVDGYHNVVRGNIAYDNELKVVTAIGSGGTGRTITDGNGIIIDSLDHSRANPLKPHYEDKNGPLAPYHGRTLVENNLMYNNGGRGIHSFRSSNVDVVNNTCYMNQKSADVNGGEYTGIEGANLTFFNNIAYGRKEKRGNTQDGSTHVIWSHNLFYNCADFLVHDGSIEADPKFVAPALDAKPEGFRLQADSPALGQGLTAVALADDLDGKPRPASGPTDLGAYQLTR